MRAAVCRAFGAPLVIEELTIAPPGPGAVAVRVEACAVCHSDVAYARGDWGGALPAVFGHEAAGRVIATGPGVRGVGPGDRVLVTLIRACGTCAACAGGAPTSCDHAWDAHPSPLRDAVGAPVRQGMNAGAFAEEVVVDASQLAPLPDDLPAELACLLACGVVTGVGAVVNVARVRPGAVVAVVGAGGGVGLNAVQGAVLAGAERVVAIDVGAAKLAAARAFGATDTVEAGPEAAAAVRALTRGRGVDAAVVTAGSATAIGGAVELLAPAGAVVVVGMLPTGTTVAYDPTSLAALNQRILGARMGQAVLARDVPWLIGHWRAGRLKLGELVSGRFALGEVNAAIAASGGGAARRSVIVFGQRA